MLNRLVLKVTKFQLPPPKRLGTVVKNILGGHHGPPCQIGLNSFWFAIFVPVILYNETIIFLGLIQHELNSLLDASHLVDYISIHI